MKHLYKTLQVITAIILCLSNYDCYAQSSISKPYFLPKVFPDAPNSATLGKFGDYPVSYYTGIPDISVPIYEIKSGDISVPITLNYHASGIKVTDIASFVGLGWSLQAGGQISRRVMGGKADEVENGYLSGKTRLTSAINTSLDSDQDYLNSILKGEYDVEPDILSYNFMGKGGKFFFNRLDGYKPALVPFAPIIINKTLANNKLSFEITDERANRFSFGKLYTEFTSSEFGGVASSAITAWKLESITAANKKDNISFSYKSQYLNTGDEEVDMWVVEDAVDKLSSDCPYQPNQNASVISSTVNSYTNEQVIDEIKFKNGKVNFLLSQSDRQDNRPGVKALAKIQIYSYDHLNGSYNLIRTVQLLHSYFINGTDATTKRLRLDAVQIMDQTGKSIQTYRFDYNTATALPSTKSRSKDYWGYYNNRPNTSLVPGQTIYYNDGNANTQVHIGNPSDNGREPDETYMKTWVLNRISYPTGGYTQFEYEANKYWDSNTQTVKLAGGLRIKSIKSYNGIGLAPVLRTYKYGTLDRGSVESGYGRANFNFGSYFFYTTQTYRYYKGYSTSMQNIGDKRVRTFLSNPSIDVQPYDGTPVTYSIVTEYEGDVTNNIGKTIYHFKDLADVISAATIVKPVITSHFYHRGQLEKKLTYRNENGIYQLVQQQLNEYSAFPQKVYSNIGLVVNKHAINDGDQSGIIYPSSLVRPNDQNSWLYSNYFIESDDNYLVSTSTLNYDQSDVTKYVESRTNYQYNNITHQQPSIIQTIDSKGIEHRTVKKYPADYLNTTGTSTGHQVLDNMLSRNMQGALVESWDEKISNNTVTASELTIYKQLASGDIVLDEQRKLEILSPITNFSPVTFSNNQIIHDSRYRNAVKFNSYDNSSNLLQYTAGSNPPVSIFWDKEGIYPIAKIINSTYALQSGNEVKEFYFQNFEEDAAASAIKAHTGKKCNYNRSFIVNFTKPNARKYLLTWFQWNGSSWVFNKETYTGNKTFSSSEYVDDIRVFPEDAELTTYTYEPLVGVTSMTDPKGQTTFYQYDTYNRLQVIRDQDNNIVKTYQYNYKN